MILFDPDYDKKKSQHLKSLFDSESDKKNNNSLFKPHAHVAILLSYVIRGNQEKVESILKEKPDLLLEKGTLSHPYGNVFKLDNASPFQNAVAAYDTHMWRMMLKYLPDHRKAQALEQLKEIDDRKLWYNFNIVTALERCFNYWNKTNYQAIVNPQLTAPIHIIQEYGFRGFWSARDFYPVPSFKETSLPREINYYDWTLHQSYRTEEGVPYEGENPNVSYWPPRYSAWNPLTRGTLLCKPASAPFSEDGLGKGYNGAGSHQYIKMDYDAMKELQKVRKADIQQELHQYLTTLTPEKSSCLIM
jgi:hypothetical protein